MISRIVLRLNLRRRGRVANQSVEVDDAVAGAAGAYLPVHVLPETLALSVVIGRAAGHPLSGNRARAVWGRRLVFGGRSSCRFRQSHEARAGGVPVSRWAFTGFGRGRSAPSVTR